MDTAFEIALIVVIGGGAVGLLKLAEAVESLAKSHERVAQSHKDLAKEVERIADRALDAIEKTFHSVGGR